MRLLIASDPAQNPYIGSLACALNEQPGVSSVMTGSVFFWMRPAGMDVLHVQWPETLFPFNLDPSDEELARLERQFGLWKKECAVVATIHNRLPHRNRGASVRRLFEAVYRQCDGIIHHGRQSVEVFKADYPGLDRPLHEVIPHGNYACYDNTVSQADARAWLGIGADRLLLLAFGIVRHAKEGKALLRGFLRFPHRRKALLVAGRMEWPNHRVLRLYERLRPLLRFPLYFHKGFVRESRVQYYLNAADIVVVPRLDQLNSGIVPLAFTFGKIVVGPESGVMGELLRQHGNPTYVPGDAASFVGAMETAARLCGTDRAAENRRVALEDWNWSKIGAAHLEFYRRCREAGRNA